MRWKYFYNNFWEWSDKKILHAISALSDIEELDFLHVAMNLKANDAKAALTKRAIKLNCYFSHHEFLYLSTVLKHDDLVTLANYAGFCAQYPEFRPSSCSWEEFMQAYPFLGKKALRNAIYNVKSFGTSSDVVKLYFDIKDDDIRRELYSEAIKKGVSFSKKEQEQIKEHIFKCEKKDVFSKIAKKAHQAAENIERSAKKVQRLKQIAPPEPPSPAPSFSFLSFLGSFSESNSSHKSSHPGKCNGDCANCPPHYGYRYGRWYYGHSHTEGCVFGGNSCSGGRD